MVVNTVKRISSKYRRFAHISNLKELHSIMLVHTLQMLYLHNADLCLGPLAVCHHIFLQSGDDDIL